MKKEDFGKFDSGEKPICSMWNCGNQSAYYTWKIMEVEEKLRMPCRTDPFNTRLFHLLVFCEEHARLFIEEKEESELQRKEVKG